MVSLPHAVGTADISAESDHMREAFEGADAAVGRSSAVSHVPGRGAVLVCVLLSLGSLVQAGESADTLAEIRQFRSRHIRLHTDVDSARALVRLRRMEDVLELASKYWGRPLPGTIDALLVEHPDRWPSADLRLPQARVVLEQIGGGTSVGPAPPSCGRHVKLQTVVFATTAAGIAEHEMVHAYCLQTFGSGGPDWYREGMAEVLAASSDERRSLCRAETLQLLQQSNAISLQQVVARSQFTRSLYQSVQRLDSLPGETTSRVAFAPTAWSPADQHTLNQTRLAYAESWALCHLLYHNPNFQQSFRRLGQRLLGGHPVPLEQTLRPLTDEIDFELKRLQEHLADGYRVDLCRWPWEATFRTLEVDASVSLRVPARGGFQATQILIAPDQEYRVKSAGQWFLGARAEPLDGDGNASGWGSIEGAILDDFRLSPTVDLGRDCAFVPLQSGKLYLRCRDRWNELTDNRGELLVRLTRIR